MNSRCTECDHSCDDVIDVKRHLSEACIVRQRPNAADHFARPIAVFDHSIPPIGVPHPDWDACGQATSGKLERWRRDRRGTISGDGARSRALSLSGPSLYTCACKRDPAYRYRGETRSGSKRGPFTSSSADGMPVVRTTFAGLQRYGQAIRRVIVVDVSRLAFDW